MLCHFICKAKTFAKTVTERESGEGERKIINTPQAKPNERITDFSANLRRSPLCVTPRQAGEGRTEEKRGGG